MMWTNKMGAFVMSKNKSNRPIWLTVISSLILIAIILALISNFQKIRVIFYKVIFYTQMETLHPPIGSLGVELQSTEIYLRQLKKIAIYILSLPVEDRYELILFYDDYINLDTSVTGRYGERVVNLFLLQRLLFDVPQRYPKEEAKVFIAWEEYHSFVSENTVNMLWPFVYDNNGGLTIEEPLGNFHSIYNGTMEYRYFLYHFQFRSITTLEK